jgi:hypothetical protein
MNTVWIPEVDKGNKRKIKKLGEEGLVELRPS